MRLNELIKIDAPCPVTVLPSAQQGREDIDDTSSPLPEGSKAKGHNSEDSLVYYRDYVGIKSKLLNDTLILCFDKSKLRLVMERHPNIPIYFPPEIEELYPYRQEGELIRWVHACKKEFGAWLVPRDKQTFRFSDQEIRNE